MPRGRSLNEKVTKINSEYVAREDQRIQSGQKRRITAKRRIFVMSLVFTVAFGFAISVVVQKGNLYTEKQSQNTELKKTLSKANEDGKSSKQQIHNLKDEEYIAKVARKEYFLSDKREMIFIAPESK